MIFLYDITNQPMDHGAFLLYEIGQYSAVREWRNVINHAPTAAASVFSAGQGIRYLPDGVFG